MFGMVVESARRIKACRSETCAVYGKYHYKHTDHIIESKARLPYREVVVSEIMFHANDSFVLHTDAPARSSTNVRCSYSEDYGALG